MKNMIKSARKNGYSWLINTAVLTILIFTSIASLYRNNEPRLSMLHMQSRTSSRTVAFLESLSKRITFHHHTEPVHADTKRQSNEKKSVFKLFLYLLGSIMTVSNKYIVILFILFLGLMMNKALSRHKEVLARSIAPRLRFYLWWSLRFLSPLEKYRKNRSDNFDINPLMVVLGGYRVSNFSPHSVL